MDSEVEVAARRAIDAINDRTLAARAGELLDPAVVRHDLVQLLPDSEGSSGGSDFAGMILGAMPDFRLDIEDIFGAGDRATVRLRMIGTHTGQPLLGQPATDKKLSASALFIYRVQRGRIAEAWQMVDGLAFFRLAELRPGQHEAGRHRLPPIGTMGAAGDVRRQLVIDLSDRDVIESL